MNDRASNGGQDDRCHPWPGHGGAGGDTYLLSPQSLCWQHRVGVGHSPGSCAGTWASCRWLESLLPRNLGIVQGQRLGLKPIFRGAWNSGGVAPCLVLQEGGTPVSTQLC